MKPDPQLLNFLSFYDGAVADLALALREIVLEEAPDAVEKIYQNHPAAVWFGFRPKMKALCDNNQNVGIVYALDSSYWGST
jgi:hypothetical protein